MQTKKEIGTIPVATRISKPMLEGIHLILKINSSETSYGETWKIVESKWRIGSNDAL